MMSFSKDLLGINNRCKRSFISGDVLSESCDKATWTGFNCQLLFFNLEAFHKKIGCTKRQLLLVKGCLPIRYGQTTCCKCTCKALKGSGTKCLTIGRDLKNTI